MENNDSNKNQRQTPLLKNPQFWSILSIFVLITLHYYDNLTSFRLFSTPDLPLGITRHTIDRILYLVPVIIASVAFGPRGGKIVLVFAVIAMIPRSMFISATPLTAMWETLLVTLIGSLVPIGLDHYRKQELQLEAARESLESTRKKLHTTVQLSEKKYRQLFENAHDAIWVQDLNNNITAANQAAADLFACPLDELLGANISQFLAVKDSVPDKANSGGVGKDGMEIEPYRRKIVRKDGSGAVVMLTSNIITASDEEDGIQFIGRDITKEVKMQEDQSYYLQKITNAHEEERQRISRDLHDSAAQNIIASLRQLENFNEQNADLPTEKTEFLWELHGHLKDTLQDIRRMSRDLRPSVLDNLGLLPAVEWIVEQLQSEDGVETTLSVSGKEKRFSPEIEVTLFRIIQEALRNIAKHAKAKHARVVLDFKENETRINIMDDGEGFVLPASIGEFSREGKLGIDGMQTRVRLAGGTFEIKSGKGGGTTITVTLPV